MVRVDAMSELVLDWFLGLKPESKLKRTQS